LLPLRKSGRARDAATIQGKDWNFKETRFIQVDQGQSGQITVYFQQDLVKGVYG